MLAISNVASSVSQVSFGRRGLFTVEQRVILYSVGKVKGVKMADVLAKARALFQLHC